MMGFRFRTSLTSHFALCKEKKPVRTVSPKKGDTLYFHNTHLMEPFPYFCVYDFEAILKPENMGHVYESHVPSSFCILVIRSTDSRIMEHFLYRGEDCVEQFISILNQMSKLIPEWIRSDLTTVKKTQKSDSHCDVCGESFDKRKRKDNDHFTGPYRLCLGCNLNERNNKKSHSPGCTQPLVRPCLYFPETTFIRVERYQGSRQ